MNTIDELKKLRQQLQLNVVGIENYPTDAPSVIVANHNRLTDIFYIPLALDSYIVSLISARLVYKKDVARLEAINKYLNAFPIEAHGGILYSKMCIDYATKFLLNDISVNIFPEGAYLPGDGVVYKGRTGSARILFNAMSNNKFAYYVPVAIETKSNDDLDSYDINPLNPVTVKILEPLITEDYYYNYINAVTNSDKNKILHEITDTAMKNITSALGRKYIPEYITLRPKNNVMFSDGSVVNTLIAQNNCYIEKYQEELEDLSNRLILK